MNEYGLTILKNSQGRYYLVEKGMGGQRSGVREITDTANVQNFATRYNIPVVDWTSGDFTQDALGRAGYDFSYGKQNISAQDIGKIVDNYASIKESETSRVNEEQRAARVNSFIAANAGTKGVIPVPDAPGYVIKDGVFMTEASANVPNYENDPNYIKVPIGNGFGYVPKGSAAAQQIQNPQPPASGGQTPPTTPPTQGGGFNLSAYIGKRPSTVDPTQTEYYDAQTNQGYSTPQQLYDAVYARTGNRPTSFSQVDALLGGTGTGTDGGPDQGSESQFTSTGNPELDAILAEFSKVLDAQLAAGKTINPNIEITPEVAKQFLDQATAEVSPYYQNMIKSIQADLTRNLDELSKSYELSKKQAESNFKASLGAKREDLAGAGLAFSGVRGKQEKQMADAASLEQEQAAQRASAAAKDAVSAAEKTIGSTNVPRNYSSLSQYGATTTGEGGFTPTRSLDFNPTGNVTGSLEYSQRGDIRTLQDFLTGQEVRKRTLAFGG